MGLPSDEDYLELFENHLKKLRDSKDLKYSNITTEYIECLMDYIRNEDVIDRLSPKQKEKSLIEELMKYTKIAKCPSGQPDVPTIETPTTTPRGPINPSEPFDTIWIILGIVGICAIIAAAGVGFFVLKRKN
jgi:hypothetical protein